MSEVSLAEYPSFYLRFDNGAEEDIELEITAQQYLMRTLSVHGDECYYFSIVQGDDEHLILGDVFMQRYEVVFDRGSKRIGFASQQGCEQRQYYANAVGNSCQGIATGEHCELAVK